MLPSHLPRKICLVGASAVGKTSLVSRFVHGVFSERYLTTIGVKVDRKTVDLGEQHVDLVVWDLNGEDRFQALQIERLRGSAGYLLVADGTRRATLDEAAGLRQRIEEAHGALPYVVVLNKADLAADWDVPPDAADAFPDRIAIVRTSARTGQGVEDAFARLAQRLV